MGRLGIGLGLGRTTGGSGTSSGELPQNGLQGLYRVRESSFALADDSITQWDDTSGSSNNLTQTSSANQSTFVEGYTGVGDELVTNGDFSDGNTGWSLASGVAITNNTLVFTSVNGGWSYSETSNAIIGNKYLLSVNIPSYTQGSVIFYDSVSGSTITTISSSGVFSVPFIANNNSNTIAFVGTSSATLDISSISVKLAQRDTSKDKISFDTTAFLNGLPPQSGDFTYVVKGIDIPNYQDEANVIFEVDYEIYGATSARFINTYGSLRINDISNAVVFLEPWSGSGDIAVTKESNTLKVYFNGVQLGSDVDVTGSSFDGIVNLSRSIFGLNGTISGCVAVYDKALNADQMASLSGLSKVFLLDEDGNDLVDEFGNKLFSYELI